MGTHFEEKLKDMFAIIVWLKIKYDNCILLMIKRLVNNIKILFEDFSECNISRFIP